MTNPRYAPAFHLDIDGAPVPAVLRASVTSVTCTTGLEGSDRVEIALANPRLQWLDHPLLRVDKPLTLTMGYLPTLPKPMFGGEIVGQSATFPADGAPVLTVTAQDRRHRMQSGTRTRWFPIPIPTRGNQPLPDQAVVAIPAAEHGLIASFDPVGSALAAVLAGSDAAGADNDAMQQLVRKQESESDFDFVGRIAKQNGWEMLIDHAGSNGLSLRFFSPADRLAPELTLKYGASLMSFTPRLTTVGQVASVTAHVWVAQLKRRLGITIGWDWDRAQLTIDVEVGGIKSSDKPSEVVLDEPVTLASAPRRLVSELIPKLNGRLTGSGSTVGTPDIRAGSVIQLEGIGEQFGGLYRVTSATHTIDSGGYRTDFEVRKEIWFGSIPLPSQGAVPIRLSAAASF